MRVSGLAGGLRSQVELGDWLAWRDGPRKAPSIPYMEGALLYCAPAERPGPLATRRRTSQNADMLAPDGGYRVNCLLPIPLRGEHVFDPAAGTQGVKRTRYTALFVAEVRLENRRKPVELSNERG